MAKPDHTWVGSSCHIHSSLWRDGESAFAGEIGRLQALPRRPDRARVGARDLLRADDQLVQALRGRQLGADDARLGLRQPHVRLPHRRARHVAARRRRAFPGADANPYLAFAALLAAGLYGIEQKLELGPPFEGNAYESDVERFPHALREAIARARERHGRAAAARRRGRRPLPELRAHRAAALRRGRDVLRAGADVRAWLDPSSASRRTSRHASWGALDARRGAHPVRLRAARSSAPARGRCSCRRATTGSRRRSTRSTGSLLLRRQRPRSRRRTARRRIPRRTASRPERDRGELALLEARARARHAGARGLPRLPGAERRARRRSRPAPARGRRQRAAPRGDGRLLRPRREDRRRLAARLGARRPRAGEVAPPPGRRPRRRRAARGRVGGRRHDRGARGSRAAVRGRRALASGGGGGPEALRGARRRGARLSRGARG